MTTKIQQKITAFEVLDKDKLAAEQAAAQAPAPSVEVAEPENNVVRMHEKLERPEALIGSTYKIKSPLFDHALYVTINDIVLNPGTKHELRRPFEIFINSKNMDHFQWIVALTRIMSAVFRKGGDITFMVEELKAVFDPRGGYFKGQGQYMPSIVAEIGTAVETHLYNIGMLKAEGVSEEQQALIDEKRSAYEASLKQASSEAATGEGDANNSFPPSASVCKKCNVKAVVLMDGCETCLNCGHSKCG